MKDISHRMPKASWKQPVLNKPVLIVIHYAAGSPVASRYNSEEQLISILQSYARYHISNIPNDSIAYTYVVDKWGNQYQTRNPVSSSYHAAHYGANTYGVGILCPLGNGEEPTQEQVISLFRLVEHLRTLWSIPRSQVYGHKELSPTTCPDRLMPYIRDYRRSKLKFEGEMKDNLVSFSPGWFEVIPNATAVIRREPEIDDNIILMLPSGYEEYIHNEVRGQLVAGSDIWYQTLSSYGKGYVHRSALRRVEV